MLALAGALVSTAHAGAAGQPVESISPGDPYASCTIGGSGTTVSAPSTEVEQFRPLFAESFAIPGNTTDVYSNVFGSGFAPTTPKAAPVTPGATTAPHLSAHRTRH
ncbi:MAG TPA: hypothetical protein VNW94_22770 [Streptosporangiaceae bacterium]|nr:hypothetical protein [Streptosporangiaceae bacterium]